MTPDGPFPMSQDEAMSVLSDLIASGARCEPENAVLLDVDDIAVARALIEAGANVDAELQRPMCPVEDSSEHYHRLTPLIRAACIGDQEMFDLLYKAGAKVDVRAMNGETLAHCVARFGQAEMLDALGSRYGIEIDTPCDNGRLPRDLLKDRQLHNAAQLGDEPTVRRLLDEGYPTQQARDEYRSTGTTKLPPIILDAPWAVAFEEGHVELGMAILNAVGCDDFRCVRQEEVPQYWNSPASLLSAMGHEHLAVSTMRSGADAVSTDVVVCAARMGHKELLREAVAAGGDVDQPYIDLFTNQVHTPLQAASSEGHAECVRLLLGAAADPNRCDWDAPALFLTAQTEITTMLIEHGADRNAVDTFGHRYEDMVEADVLEAIESTRQKDVLVQAIRNTEEETQRVSVRRRM